MASGPWTLGIVVTPTSNSSTCDGSIVATKTSGSAQGTITWQYSSGPFGPFTAFGTGNSATLTGLCPGITIYITANDVRQGWGQSDAIVIPSAIPLTPPSIDSYGAIGPSCITGNDASLHVNVSGGTAPYTLWLSKDGGTYIQVTNPASGLGNGTYSFYVIDSAGQQSLTRGIVLSNTTPCAMPSDYTVSGTSVDPSCVDMNDGEIHIVLTHDIHNYNKHYYISKNAGPFVLCSKDIYNLTNGSYVVRATEIISGYSADSAPIVLNSVTVCVLGATLIKTDATCPETNDGQIAIVAIFGGPPPFTVSYTDNGGPDIPVVGLGSNPVTGLINGHTYIFKVTDSAANVWISAPIVMGHQGLCTPFQGTCTPTNPLCVSQKDGSFAINIARGYPPYSYQYTYNAGMPIDCLDVVANLGIGDYIVTATDLYGRVITWDFTMSAPNCIDPSQFDIMWANLLCCSTRLWDTYLEKQANGDKDVCCLKKRALTLQMIIEIIKHNTSQYGNDDFRKGFSVDPGVPGYITVQDAGLGVKHYTLLRNFTVDNSGNVITAEGYFLQGSSGGPMSNVVVPLDATDFRILHDGSAQWKSGINGTWTNIIKVRIATFTSPELLQDIGNGYFDQTGGSGQPSFTNGPLIFSIAQITVDTCLTADQLEDLFQLALSLCDECECSENNLKNIINGN